MNDLVLDRLKLRTVWMEINIKLTRNQKTELGKIRDECLSRVIIIFVEG